MEFHVISNSKQTDFIGKGRVIERDDVESVDDLLANMISGCALVISSVIQDISKSQATKKTLLDVSMKALQRAVEKKIEKDADLGPFNEMYQKWFASCSYSDESKLFSDVEKYDVMPCLRYNAREDTILVRLEGRDPASGFCETIGSVPKKLFDENQTDALAKIREFNLVATLLFIRIFGKNKKFNPLIADDYIPLDKRIPTFLRSISSFKIVNGKTLTHYWGWGDEEEAVFVPDGITTIYRDIFEGKYIEKVILPAGLSTIKAGAFRWCRNLEEIFIPESVTTIEQSAFWGCVNLKSISLPPHLTTISGSLFYDCGALEVVKIPDSVTNIEEEAFQWCDNLTIYGSAGSYAEQYAKDNDIPFIAV